MEFNIAVLPGDYIGPEVVAEAVKVLNAIGKKYGHKFIYHEDAVGGAAVDKYGVPVRNETLEMCRKCDAILFGAAGGPKWETGIKRNRADTALVKIRKAFDLFSNLRIVKVYPPLVNATNLKPEVIKDVDLIILRELTSGLYYGEPRGIVENQEGEKKAFNLMVYTEAEIERVLRVGFELARSRRKKLLSVDKSNVLEVSLLWRQTAIRLASEYPDVELSHMYVDAAAQKLINKPGDIDVLVTENTFGDILSDEASELGGSMGMIPSASLSTISAGKAFGLYEPIHGSDPRNAGKFVDNPIATILSAGLLLQYSCGLVKEASVVEAAVTKVLEKGYRTWDILKGEGKEVGTREMGDLIVEEIEKA
jgi:3-isopropylmalate dehydrogenase